jgi:hypothetical protein
MLDEPFIKIFEALIIRPMTSYRWVKIGAMFFLPNQSHNHMADVQVMCLHFFFKNIFVVLVLNRDLMLLHPKIRG